ncbi:MAG: RNA methyltransferase [Bacteroidales bacterium]|nr:RNA methyltransferase [Bacteroidales bacterium]
MISKGKLKELAAYRLQKRCDEEAVFVVEGPKMAAEAAASGFTLRTVCATPAWLASNSIEAGEVLEVTEAELERLSSMRTPNQVWLLAERRQPRMAEEGRLTLALDRLQDPGNMGTLLRTADWFGVRHVVCSPGCADRWSPKVVQASMGAVFRTRVDTADLPEWLAGCGMEVYGASLQGEPLATAPRPEGRAVLLIGNESRGISPDAMRSVTHRVLIPNLGGTAESLNAAVAAGILINHFCN